MPRMWVLEGGDGGLLPAEVLARYSSLLHGVAA